MLIMTPEKQDKTLEFSKHWSPDSTRGGGEGGEGRGEQRRGFRTKALMQDLGTRFVEFL